MNDLAKSIARDLAVRTVVIAGLLAIGYVAHKREMKRLNNEYRDLCETVKI